MQFSFDFNPQLNRRDEVEVGGCKDPLKATLDTLQCISDSNATCAGANYNTEEFKKYHNGKDTNT